MVCAGVSLAGTSAQPMCSAWSANNLPCPVQMSTKPSPLCAQGRKEKGIPLFPSMFVQPLTTPHVWRDCSNPGQSAFCFHRIVTDPSERLWGWKREQDGTRKHHPCQGCSNTASVKPWHTGLTNSLWSCHEAISRSLHHVHFAGFTGIVKFRCRMNQLFLNWNCENQEPLQKNSNLQEFRALAVAISFPETLLSVQHSSSTSYLRTQHLKTSTSTSKEMHLYGLLS